MKELERMIIVVCLSLLPACKQATAEPSKNEFVEVARNSVVGKTYDEKVTDYRTVVEYRNKQVPCSQYDYDLDPRKGDPNAGTCRGRGGLRGYGYKTVRESYNERVPYEKVVTRSCPAPPAPGDPTWSVISIGKDKWQVTGGTYTWTVTKTDSGMLVAQSTGKC